MSASGEEKQRRLEGPLEQGRGLRARVARVQHRVACVWSCLLVVAMLLCGREVLWAAPIDMRT